MQALGKYLVIAGIGITVIGLIFWIAGNKFNWFGNLPGDIRIEGENFRFYAPFGTMILLSILFSLILWLIRKYF